MKTLKKISVITMALVMLFTLAFVFTLNGLSVSAKEETGGGVTTVYETEIINSSIEELGIPASLDFEFEYEDKDLSSPFTLNGFTYRGSGTACLESGSDTA